VKKTATPTVVAPSPTMDTRTAYVLKNSRFFANISKKQSVF